MLLHRDLRRIDYNTTLLKNQGYSDKILISSRIVLRGRLMVGRQVLVL